MEGYCKDKKVLVTGADGFIGSHLTERLAQLGADVRAFVYYNSLGSWGWLNDTDDDLMASIEIFPGDIRDAVRVRDAVRDCEIVFHLASLIAIPYSYAAPQSYVETNISGALNILNACREEQGVKLVHTSTSEVYGTAQYVPIDENHPLQGQSPYSASKIGADKLAESYHLSFDLPVATVRPFNTYGPRQSARAVIPTILTQLISGKKTLRLGNLEPVRDFNFVADTVEGFLAVATSDTAIGRVVNIGSGQGITISDLVQLLLEATDSSARIVCEEQRVRPEGSEVDRLICNASLAFDLTGWKPAYTLKQGLEITAEWISANLSTYHDGGYVV